MCLAYSMMVTQVFAQGYSYVETKNYDFESKADHSQMIKKVFDTYRYRMTVEWDQNDSAFKEFAKAEFEKDVLELQAKGVSIQEIQNYMTSNMLNSQAKNDYHALVTTLRKQGKTDEEIASITGKFMEKNYNVGASYSGGASSGWTALGIILAVAIVVVITVIIIREHNDDDHDNGDDPDFCEWGYNDCYPTVY